MVARGPFSFWMLASKQQREAMVVMRQSSGNGRWMLKGLGGLCGAFLVAVACAGGDTPPRDLALEQAIIDRYDNAVGQAGSVGMAGSGGGGGQGGSANAGSGGGGGAPSGGSGGSGVAGSGAAGSGGGDVCNAPATILIPRCGSAGCHGAGSAIGNFGESEAAAEALVGETANCNSALQYFNAANPQNSLVVTKLEDAPPCGSPMPIGGDPLTPDEVNCILEWVGQF
jgi:hypothetical protein